MTPSLPSWMRAGFVPAALAFVLIFAGCSSDPRPGSRGGAAPQRRKPTPMAGQETFFNTRILAQITVGLDGVPDATAPDDRRGGGEGGGEGRGGRRRGGGGQMSIAGGGGGFGGNVSGGMPFGGGGESHRGPGGEGGPRGGPGSGGGRPVMIHLKFTNQGSESVTLRIDDFTSPLGNFVVRPDQLTLEPGQSLETEPMSSQLAAAYSEVDATLVLRLGSGSEKKTFRLKAVKPPADGQGGDAQAANPPKS